MYIRAKEYLSNFLLFASLLIIGCGNEGEPEEITNNAGDDVPINGENPPYGSSVEKAGAIVDFSMSSGQIEASCSEISNLNIDLLDSDQAIRFDGIQDAPGGTQILSSAFNMNINARIFRRGNDIYIYGNAPKNTELRLSFKGARYFSGSLYLDSSLVVDLSSVGEIFVTKDGKKRKISISESGTKAKTFTLDSKNRSFEILLHKFDLDSVSRNSFFWVEPALSLSSDIDSYKYYKHKIFDSFYPVEGASKSSNLCTRWLGARSGENLQVLSFFKNFTDDTFDDSDFSHLRYGVTALGRFMKWDSRYSPVTLVTAPARDLVLGSNSSSTMFLPNSYISGNGYKLDSQRLSLFELAKQLIRKNYIDGGRSQDLLSEFYIRAYTYSFIERIYGLRFLFNSFRNLDHFQSSVEEEVEIVRLDALSMLVSQHKNVDLLHNLFEALLSAVPVGGEINDIESLIGILISLPSGSLGDNDEKLRRILQNEISGDSSLGALNFNDKDRDGLWDAMEYILGTDVENSDSDGDGWLDATEFFKQTNPRNLSDYPQQIVIDGFVNDWFSLMPAQLIGNSFVNEACPSDSDITYYAAIRSGRRLAIFASNLESTSETNDTGASWFANVEIKEFDLRLAVSVNDDKSGIIINKDHDGVSSSYLLSMNTPLSGSGIEWEIPFDQLGLGWVPSETPIAVSVSTSFTKNRRDICDETGVFAPYLAK